MLQSVPSVFVVYRRKTLTGSPDPTHANGTNKPCSNTKLAFLAITSFLCYIYLNEWIYFVSAQKIHFSFLQRLRCLLLEYRDGDWHKGAFTSVIFWAWTIAWTIRKTWVALYQVGALTSAIHNYTNSSRLKNRRCESSLRARPGQFGGCFLVVFHLPQRTRTSSLHPPTISEFSIGVWFGVVCNSSRMDSVFRILHERRYPWGIELNRKIIYSQFVHESRIIILNNSHKHEGH